VQCHGEHTLVEIFNKRGFVCDCGTTRFPDMAPCTLRLNVETGTKGGVKGEERNESNVYNQNFRNRFCGCECDYDPYKQRGTMFQCLGLGTHETGGCGEDWWHPGCIVGLGPDWEQKTKAEQEKPEEQAKPEATNGALPTIAEDAAPQPPAAVADPAVNGDADGTTAAEEEDDDPPPPPGFPKDEEFEGFLCYKCVEANPWIRRYAGAPGFLPPVFLRKDGEIESLPGSDRVEPQLESAPESQSKKRKAEDEEDALPELKRQKSDTGVSAVLEATDLTAATETRDAATPMSVTTACKLNALGPAPDGRFSLFFTAAFRDALCRCPSCFPLLRAHTQLLDEEETYEPPVSDHSASDGGSTHGSLLDRGESALRNVDRVRAIEGVMAFNQLKDKLKPFFQQYAESGEAISAEDIKAYFAKLRGDDQTGTAKGAAAADGGAHDGDGHRKEQSGY
jgi:E3 ubiquitin-protein ligase UBR7